MATRRKPRKQDRDPVVAELSDIKRLLMLQLITSGVQAVEIGATLGLTKSNMSRLIPARKIKKRK